MKSPGAIFTLILYQLFFGIAPVFADHEAIPHVFQRELRKLQPVDESKINYGPAINLLPPKVAEAVKKSQGLLAIGVVTWRGAEPSYGNGVLLGSQNHVLVPDHALSKYFEIACGETTVYLFNRTHAKLIAGVPAPIDLATLELNSPIAGMAPAELADSYQFGETYYGLSLMQIDTGVSLLIEAKLIGHEGSYLVFNRAAEPGVSGTPLWNKDGKLVGVVVKTGLGYLRAVRVEMIRVYRDTLPQWSGICERKGSEKDKK